MIKIDTADSNIKIDFPEWIKVSKEVTGDKAYASANLARLWF